MKKNVIIFLLGAVSGSSFLTWLVLRSKWVQEALVIQTRESAYRLTNKLFDGVFPDNSDVEHQLYEKKYLSDQSKTNSAVTSPRRGQPQRRSVIIDNLPKGFPASLIKFLSVPCPHCGAAVDNLCEMTERPGAWLHFERIGAYEAANDKVTT